MRETSSACVGTSRENRCVTRTEVCRTRGVVVCFVIVPIPTPVSHDQDTGNLKKTMSDTRRATRVRSVGWWSLLLCTGTRSEAGGMGRVAVNRRSTFFDTPRVRARDTKTCSDRANVRGAMTNGECFECVERSWDMSMVSAASAWNVHAHA